jgi:hypothetical protein
MLVAGAIALAGCGKQTAKDQQAQAPAEAAKPAAAQPAAAPTAMPLRTPGLWEQKITTAGFSQTSRLCLDKAVAEKTAAWGERPGETHCQQTTTPKLGGGWDFTATCDMGKAGKTMTKGSATGDFAKSYKVETESTTTGADTPQMNGVHKVAIEATWQGPCPAGMLPGDMVLPNGMKINMMQMPGG